MKGGQWILIVGFVLPMLTACRKEDAARTSALPPATAIPTEEETSALPPATAIPTEEELWEERKRLKAQDEEASFRYGQLKQNIGDLKVMIAETKENLQRAQAEKEKLLAVEADLKKRWEKELEGYGIGSVEAPIIDIYRRMVYKTEELLQENRDLKRQLEEAGK